MNKIFTTLLFIGSISLLSAQNVGIGTATPNASAKLEITDANRGVLIPRVNLTATNAAGPVTAPATSLLVYNNATAGVTPNNVTPGYYYWDGTKWVRFATREWTITSNNFNSNGTQSIVTSIPSTITSSNAAWLVGGNALTATGNLGTTSNNHVDLISNNIVRGRLSNLGEFFIGTTNTVLAGDLMNGVGNATFPWALNGYTVFNGGGTYGRIELSNNTVFGGVQGEYYGNNATGAGVRGISDYDLGIGVSGQETSYIGWAMRADGDIGTTGGYFTISDKRLKTNISSINNALSKVSALRGVEYDYDVNNYKKYTLNPRHQVGFIAQELEKVIPEAVTEKIISTTNTRREDGGLDVETMKIKVVNVDAVIPVLVEAIKEQQAMIDKQQKQIDQLKKEVELLKK